MSTPRGRFARASAFVAICFVLGSGSLSAAPHALVRGLVSRDSQPPTDAFCRTNFDSPCYSPQEMRTAYGITLGNNALLDIPGAVAPGYSATPGWDPASGWGSPNLVGLPKHAFELLEH